MTAERKNPTVAELKAHDPDQTVSFESVFLLRKVSARTARNGSEFLSVELGDKTGAFHIVCFNDTAMYLFFNDAEEGSVVRVQGHTEYYQDRFSPRLNYAEPVPPQEVEEQKLLNSLLESSVEDPGELWEELLGYVDAITHEPLRNTVRQVLDETEETFKTIAAAIAMHHAYRSGLLEHTVHLCRACKALLPHYPEVNADLAMSGLIVHDVGKTVEYTGDRVTTRSRKGILQGHVVLGYRLVRKAAIQSKLEPALTERLEHIVLSHQGELEWGAAARAATPEAVFVSMLDNLDAKMGMVQHALRNTPVADEFSDYMPGLQAPVLTTPIDLEPSPEEDDSTGD